MNPDPNIALTIKDISKSYGDQKVLHQIDLAEKDKEFLILLGPSGCGKTTLLKIVAGLLSPNSGSVTLNGKDITDMPTYNRDIGMVFQNYALFPHMTVFQNVAFGLRMRKVPKSDISRRVQDALQLVRLKDYGNRPIKQLSGGQQQRVALARALVLNPSLLLLDEPLSNLDAKLRAQVRVEIAQIQRELGLTTILVTHDQTEAMTMGDRIILLQDGVIQQSATPTKIYEQPANLFVASFIGSPQINVFRCTKSGTSFHFDDFDHTIPVEKIQGIFFPDIGHRNLPDGQYDLGVRPEDFTFDGREGAGLFNGTVFFVENLGADYFLHAKIGQKTIIVRNPQGIIKYAEEGCEIELGFRPGRAHLFDGNTHQRVHLE
ncbi:MAG: ABC transporter ATP-binding protein [Bellilinea sp.]